MIQLEQGEQRRIRLGISRRVFELSKSKADNEFLFKGIHSDLKRSFNVRSYKDIKRKELPAVLRYIDNWKP